MKKLPVIIGTCTGCGYCIMACPEEAVGPINPHSLNERLCTSCGKCVQVCPTQGRVLRERQQ